MNQVNRNQKLHDAEETLHLGVKELGLNLEPKIINKLLIYKDLLIKWNKKINLTDQYLIHIVLHYIPLFLILYVSISRNDSVINNYQLLLLISTLFIYFLVNRFDYNKILTEYHNIFNKFESMIVSI